MSTDLAVRPQQAILATDEIKYLANTEFVQPGLRGNLPAIFAAVATGRALGIPDIVALRCIHVIDGKPSFSAELQVAQVRQRGHSIIGEVTDLAATVTGTRADNGDTMTFTFTVGMAERAGLLRKQNWQKYPEAMCWARAVSQLCRMLFADVFAGATYTPEELEGSAGEPQADASKSDGETVSQADHREPASAAEEVFGPPSPPDPGVNPTQKQIKYLNLTVGPMDQAFKRRVWATVALMRVRDTDALILELGGIDGAGVLHWSPLRDTLTKREAHELIEKLEALERERAAAEASA